VDDFSACVDMRKDRERALVVATLALDSADHFQRCPKISKPETRFSRIAKRLEIMTPARLGFFLRGIPRGADHYGHRRDFIVSGGDPH